MSTNGHSHPAPPILLTIAGFDPSCGAGTAADLKTFAAHGCYGVAAITALTAQLAAGRGLLEAATLSKAYVTKAIEKGYPIGKGRVPLDHFYRQRIEPPARGIHEVPQHGMHPAAEPTTH